MQRILPLLDNIYDKYNINKICPKPVCNPRAVNISVWIKPELIVKMGIYKSRRLNWATANPTAKHR
jgi:hypothetical protein